MLGMGVNIEIGEKRIENVGTIIGTVIDAFTGGSGEATQIGRKIDEATKNITIKIEEKQ